jgi:hypothetical protein
MPLTIFLALCTLGCDFLLFFLFQWVYGEKRRLRRLPPRRHLYREGNSSDLVVLPASTTSSSQPNLSSTRALLSSSRAFYRTPFISSEPRLREQLAYRRIASSLAPTRSRKSNI